MKPQTPYNRNGRASLGYIAKLARSINSKYHVGYDDAQFCKKHGIMNNGNLSRISKSK